MQRCTIAETVEYSGIGIHSGERTHVRLLPAIERVGDLPSGIVFWRNGVPIPAHVNYVKSTARGITLGNNDVQVHTVEHLLATLWAFGITDVHIEVEGCEIPIGGGDASHWVELLRRAGRLTLPGVRQPVRLPAPLEIHAPNEDAYIRAWDAPQLRVRYIFARDHPLVGRQEFTSDELRNSFASEIAPARTFAFIEEVESLLQRGFGQGGSFDNCLVIYPDHYSAPLRFYNELVRHKVLDLLGDLMLLGSDLCASVEVYRGGHELHVAFIRDLWQKVGACDERASGGW